MTKKQMQELLLKVYNESECAAKNGEIERLRAMLSWIEDHDPQIVAAARVKFGIVEQKAPPK